MIQFTVDERKRLRERSSLYPDTIQRLKNETDEIFHGEIIVPKSGIANWTLYYYCPDCSVKLKFDRTSPHRHRCPSCKKTFTGEPYDSSWWGLINMKNYEAVFSMAVIWLATGEQAYADKAIKIMKEYAAYYPDYEVHGDIPYNGPGRAGAQTLDEANFQRTFAMAYDLLSECMSEEEKTLIRDHMLLPGAEFLMAHRNNQIHNHEVIINSAIAVIGILFDRPELVHAAMYEKYGILYQLEHGMLENKMWFEGAFGYHFYALTSFFAFEKFAIHTKYSNIHHPNYRKMLEMVCGYMDSEFDLPLSDTIVSLTRLSSSSELAETSIGQGKTLVTPLYMAMLISSVANDGVMMQPYMIEKISNGEGETRTTTVPKVLDTVMTPAEADRLTEMLTEVINRGTGTAAKLRGYQAAGKTGTAENSGEYDHSWFVGFATDDNPQVAVAVVLENVSGSARATPIGAKLMQAVLDKNNGESISDNNYTYTPPAEPEDNNGDDLNSETEIVEDVVEPEDDYVIGSDTINGNPETNTEPNPETNPENPDDKQDTSENLPEGNGTQENNTTNEGNGDEAVPDEYNDEQGHKLEIVDK